MAKKKDEGDWRQHCLNDLLKMREEYLTHYRTLSDRIERLERGQTVNKPVKEKAE